MKLLVLGSGVIGVSSAYELALAGHEVTVVDHQPVAALETSYANAGVVSPGDSAPWAGPGVPIKAITWLLMRHGRWSSAPTSTSTCSAGAWRCGPTARVRATS